MKSSGSGKKKSAKSATTIGDFFPLKKSKTTKNKRNKDEQERSGKKKLKNFNLKDKLNKFKNSKTHKEFTDK